MCTNTYRAAYCSSKVNTTTLPLSILKVFTYMSVVSVFFVAGIGYNTSDLQGFDAVAYQYIVNKTWTTQNS